MPIHHIQIWVPDLKRAVRSWGWLLETIGYRQVRSWDHGRLYREDSPAAGSAIAIEASPDMVPGMLHSRLRPGMNHVAFVVDGDAGRLAEIAKESRRHGWTPLEEHHGHPLGSPADVRYLEDSDGFEVELVTVGASSPVDGEY